jgi:hypothetical protein
MQHNHNNNHTECNAAIQDVHEKIRESYEIRDPYGILRFLETLDLDASGSDTIIMMRSRL